MYASKHCLKNFWISVFIIGILNFGSGFGLQRQINCSVYSDSNGVESEPLNVVHVTAVDELDTIHYLWSSYKLPSVIVARSTSETKVHIDFEKLKTFETGAIQFTDTPLVFIGLTISELWQMTYSSSSANIDAFSSIRGLGMEFFSWNSITNKTFSCSQASAFVSLQTLSDNEVFSRNGSLGIQFSVEGKEVSSTDYPHLIYNMNSTQVRVTMDNLYSNSSSTRYGLEMLLFSSVSQDCSADECGITRTSSMSDEYSPGVFYDIDVLPPCSKPDNENGAFLTWKPVASSSKTPSVSSSSDTTLSPKCPQSSVSSARSIAELYFRDSKRGLGNAFNITFGTVDDGFYPKTGYTSWSLMVGTGEAIHTELSGTAILFISVGLGALAVFFLAGAIFLVVRWCRRRDDFI